MAFDKWPSFNGRAPLSVSNMVEWRPSSVSSRPILGDDLLANALWRRCADETSFPASEHVDGRRLRSIAPHRQVVDSILSSTLMTAC
jgi:hypothetical protein